MLRQYIHFHAYRLNTNPCITTHTNDLMDLKEVRPRLLVYVVSTMGNIDRWGDPQYNFTDFCLWSAVALYTKE